jgi:uncharacterized protein YigA (DUF484 family)
MTQMERLELKRLYRKRDKLLSHCENNEELNEKIRALQSKKTYK